VNSLAALTIDNSWSLFLDRDGVINQKLDNDYVKSIEEFIFIQGVMQAMQNFRSIFGRLLVVTNQQGIGKGIMTHEELHLVHNYMEEQLGSFNVKFDALYYCPELAEQNAACRKPNIGLAIQAKKDFPEIDFSKSILIGDSITDIQMGKRAGMKTVFIHAQLNNPENADWVVRSLEEFSMMLENS
tara:strand:- start:43828 stop:44382 length:555 start_codon:yes stop_codon:yes gene_type:complete